MGGYLYGLNGKENDNEVKGEGNQVDFGARIYDPRIGRWNSLDPYQKKYPSFSPYNFVLNSPNYLKDVDGRDVGVTISGNTITFSNTFFLQGSSQVMLDHINKEYNRMYNGKLGGKYVDATSGKEYTVKFEFSFKIATNDDIVRISQTSSPLAESLVKINPNSGNGYSSGDIGGNIIRMDRGVAYDIGFYLHEGSHNLGLSDRYDNMALIDDNGFRAKLPKEFEHLDNQSITQPGFEGDPLGGNYKLDENNNLVPDKAVNYTQKVVDQFASKALEYSKNNNATKFVLDGNLDTEENKNKGGFNKIRKVPVKSAENIINKKSN
ncbi:hypothetical protein DVR12_17590 [Chitinophaga silvatica]|uniref:RHS repeat-associated core domain-containing protein n=1 Tax=Chitinophaga silvatica TaxID=2282649 RepID=A0A3E1Y8F0_9BACT|nr:RHS repeat-associated core domain-containing protein [Chitinophaga silvatica]RFS21148.1 hypothetical protein DVR12_17590 [Chitinophaga silvatica]